MTAPRSIRPLFSDALAAELCQGDLFVRFPITEILSDTVTTEEKTVIVISHDCEIDKRDAVLLVAAVRPLAQLDPGRQGEVRRGRVKNAMHVPEVGGLPEGFLDFRFIHRVTRDTVVRCHERGLRVASMSADGRVALCSYIYRFFSRSLPTAEQ